MKVKYNGKQIPVSASSFGSSKRSNYSFSYVFSQQMHSLRSGFKLVLHTLTALEC